MTKKRKMIAASTISQPILMLGRGPASPGIVRFCSVLEDGVKLDKQIKCSRKCLRGMTLVIEVDGSDIGGVPNRGEHLKVCVWCLLVGGNCVDHSLSREYLGPLNPVVDQFSQEI